MGAFFIYILKSSVCLVLFYLFFRLLLSKETFHRFNRVALLGVLFVSLLIPFIEVTTNHQAEVQQTMLTIEQLLLMAEQETTAADAAVHEAASISWVEIVLLVYLAGIAFFACRNLYSLVRLFRLIHAGKREKWESGITLVVHQQEIAPFSWMKYIVISRKDLEENGREILIHETAHVRHRHSIDLLLADICIFFQWFNPGVWLLKQELQNIHEYEADETVIGKGVNAKEYQLLLIKKAVGTRLYSMANSFNHSKLKKRITMMLKEKSNPWARLKYLYVLPLAAIAVTAFARPEITEKVEEISVVKVTDLTENVQEKVLQDTVKASKREKKAVAVSETKAKQQPLVIVDGKETTVEAMHALDPSTIESISVLKDSASMEIYRGCGANGAIVVTLKKEGQSAKSQANAVPDFRVSGTVAGEQGSAKVGVTGGIKGINAVFVNGVKGTPLYIIDGKEVTNESLSKIEQNRIKSISILKDESTTSTYGERGKNGVILVELLTDEEYEARQNKK